MLQSETRDSRLTRPCQASSLRLEREMIWPWMAAGVDSSAASGLVPGFKRRTCTLDSSASRPSGWEGSANTTVDRVQDKQRACTMDSRASRPSRWAPAGVTGTPITGSGVAAATMPGRCAAPPAPAMMTCSAEPRRRRTSRLRAHAQVCAPDLKSARQSPRGARSSSRVYKRCRVSRDHLQALTLDRRDRPARELTQFGAVSWLTHLQAAAGGAACVALQPLRGTVRADNGDLHQYRHSAVSK